MIRLSVLYPSTEGAIPRTTDYYPHEATSRC